MGSNNLENPPTKKIFSDDSTQQIKLAALLRRSLVLALTELYCYISPTMENVGEMVKLLQLSLWNQRLIK
ncbi:MAG: hypothetical protein V7K26_27600 [Nostoc sp.]|uniref:hypothetical protein n=1 Tax=Nostoc sp. TaxID=1180 RepID=UPI002FEFB5FB